MYSWLLSYVSKLHVKRQFQNSCITKLFHRVNKTVKLYNPPKNSNTPESCLKQLIITHNNIYELIFILHFVFLLIYLLRLQIIVLQLWSSNGNTFTNLQGRRYDHFENRGRKYLKISLNIIRLSTIMNFTKREFQIFLITLVRINFLPNIISI